MFTKAELETIAEALSDGIDGYEDLYEESLVPGDWEDCNVKIAEYSAILVKLHPLLHPEEFPIVI